jgi:hypothetical protein
MSRNFSERNARRIARVVTRIEKLPRNAIGRNRYPIFNDNKIYVYVTGTVTGIVGAQLGTGTGNLCSRSITGVLTALSPAVPITFDNVASGFSGPAYVALEWNSGNFSTVNVKCT